MLSARVRLGLPLRRLRSQPQARAAAASASTEAAAPAAAAARKTGTATPERGGGAAGGALDVQPPKGTRDFPPDEMRQRQWLFAHFRETALAFGFEEWDAPVLESEQLYTRKAGEEITQQLYNFEDKGGRKVSLRPELTPSLARLILQKGKALQLPAKWFAIGQCWRYERMTRGRRREHYQWNMDIVGVSGVEAEVELLGSVVAFFERVGLTAEDVGIKVSSRKVLQAVVAKYGVAPDAFAPVCVIVDKMDKLPREKVEEELAAIGVAAETVEGILSALEVGSLEALRELLGDEAEALADLERLFMLAEAYGFADWLVFDASVVRGLAYYTGTVFEGFDRAGNLRAICGGGRYDKLLETFGGAPQPMCGFGFGDAVIVELLKEKNLLPESISRVDDLVVSLDSALRPQAMGVAANLRAQGRKVDFVLEDKKMKWVFNRAEKVGAARVVMVGKREWDDGEQVRVKVLATREEYNVPATEVA
mmetsp:Transcript_7916/g.26289  ORF Transcript_7916/g.26289 Transcript_7916/m.26289 type:complete len:480 (+) Transcript_7916:48-1487(+)|eukprot:CAMPEP_0170141538 /NCGR_PEP_ID=MMETSP0033_2-20121228/7063_1 /TAXON_ID=195969 /ORGANISM="Dolichomastix tenuilepis, Strain CCMP3274" /LENGTH=479 /DNA_ID=CAMNT_0010377815 /DNA_START=75 /DNA_END=1514 /DNA_ORIENTATION=-